MTISATERASHLRAFAEDFFEHQIPRTEGVSLTPEIRWAIAKCAIDASTNCSGCQALPKNACLRPGTRIFPLLEKLDHCRFPNTTTTDIQEHEEEDSGDSCTKSTELVETTLRNLIHTLINHQARMDLKWYQDTVQVLKDCRLAAEYDEEEKDDPIQVHSIFAEILILSLVTHGIHSTCLLLDQSLPDLPEPPPSMMTSKIVPSPVSWKALTKANRKLRRDPKHHWGPFYLSWDFDWSSSEMKRLLPDKKSRNLFWFLFVTDTLPYLSLSLAPVDFMKILLPFHGLYYMDEITMMTSYLRLPSNRCEGFSRFDCEVVSTTVAAAHDCAFWRDGHTLVKRVAANAVTVDPERQELLAALARSITTRPLDNSFEGNTMAKARQQVVDRLGQGALVEAAGVAGVYEVMTKLTTATGRQLPSYSWLAEYTILPVFGFLLQILKLFCGFW